MVSMSDWFSLIQTIATVGGVLLIVYQLRQVEKAVRGEYHDMLSSHMREILSILVANPELRPYFYENKPVDRECSDYSKALMVSELFADLFEHVIQKKAKLSGPLWRTWKDYIQRLYSCSPILRTFISENSGMYTEEVLALTLGAQPETR